MTDARHFKWWRTPIRLTQNWAKSTRKTTTWNLLQNVQHNPRNQGYQLLEWVYVTEYVTTGSLWVLKIPKVSLNTLKYKWKHYGTVAFTANPFPVQWFKLFFSNCLWNCVTATSSRLAEKIEKQDRSPHFPLWPGIIFPGRFLFISDVINAFQRKVWGAVCKNIISDRFSTKTAISVHIQLSLAEVAISACRDVISGRDSYLSMQRCYLCQR